MASPSRAWSHRAEIRCALTEDWLEHCFNPASPAEEGTQLAPPAMAEPLTNTAATDPGIAPDIDLEDGNDPGAAFRGSAPSVDHTGFERSRGPADGPADRSDRQEGSASRRSQCPSAAVSDPVPPRSLRDLKLHALVRSWQENGFQPRPRKRFATDWSAFDTAFGGGLPRAAVHELLAATAAAPTRTLAFRLALRCIRPLAEPSSRSGWILYLDQEPDLHPPALLRLGVPLERLLVVRPRRREQAQWVCELALRTPGISVVIAGLPGLDATGSRRLQLAAEQHGTLGLVLRSDRPREGTFAFSRLRVNCCRAGGLARTVEITVQKLREANPPDPFRIRLPLRDQDYHRATPGKVPSARPA